MRSAWWGFAAAGMLLLGGHSASAQTPAEILVRSLTPADTTYVGEQVTEVTRPPDGRATRVRQTVYRRGNVLCIRYSGGRGQVLYDDGKQSQVYLPRAGVVRRGPSRLAAAEVRNRRRLIQSGRAVPTRLPDSTVAGRAVYVLQVKPPRAPARAVWIDQETYLVLRMDESLPGGGTRSTYFTSIQFDAVPTDAQLAFNPPSGVRYVDAREAGGRIPLPRVRAARLAQRWGGILAPRYLPPGYQFRGFFQHDFGGQPALVSVYAAPRPRRTLSLFQGPAVGMGGMSQQAGENLRVLSARKGSAEVTLVGPLPQDELQKVMDSIAAP